jgi:hypothetical protein
MIAPVRRIAPVAALAIAGSQAGHLLTYQLRYGAAAQQVQSSGAHAYFPLVARTVLGAAAMSILAALLIIGFARLATGRRLDPHSAPSLLRLLSLLYTIQLAIFIAQETFEGSRAGELVLWGFAGQLPVALAGAVALRWLAARFEPSLARLWPNPTPVLQLVPVTVPVVRTAPAADLAPAQHLTRGFDRRGPPF